MYRSGHALFLSLKEESHFSLVEASANNSDPIYMKLANKGQDAKAEGVTGQRKSNRLSRVAKYLYST